MTTPSSLLRPMLVVGGLALVLLVVPWASAGTSSVGGAPPSISVGSATQNALAPGSVYNAPFAVRAGYNASLDAQVSDAEPATGTQLVVVTFEPTSDALYVPPAPGATPLTQGEVAQRYGLSAAQYQNVARYFVSQGLRVVHSWPDRLALTVEGGSVQLDRAFDTTLRAGTFDGRPVLYPVSPPSLPVGIQPLVAAVTGLSSGFTTFSLPLSSSGSASPDQGGSLITPDIARNNLYDIAGLYNLTATPTYATGQQLAVLLWGDGYDPNDLTTFFSQFYPSGYPTPVIKPYPVDGAPEPSANAVNDPDAKAPQELTLDLEWSASMAVGATVDAVYAPDGPGPSYSPTTTTMVDALNQAISLQPAAISMSFGTPESTDVSLRAAWDTALASAAQSGIALLAATGDTGGDTGSGCTGGPAPEYPSTNPDVIAVGGTDVTLQTDLLGITGFTESAWSLSGGGFSTQYGEPSWQTDAIPSDQSGGARGVPDVSASAAYDFVYYDGQSLTAGGTSFATPLWAGLLVEMDALHGRSLGFLPPRLYAVGTDEPSGHIGTGLADITSGSNCVANAGPGWDAVTGWGSPRGVTLYEELTATFVNLSIATSATAVPPGGTVTITAHLANATTGRPIAAVPVEVSLTSDVNVGPCTGQFGAAKPTTGPTGNVSVAIAIPDCYLGSHAIATVTVTSNALYGVNSTSVGVNLLAFTPALEGITTYPENVYAYVAIMAIAIALGGAIGAGLPGARRPRRYARVPAVAPAMGPIPPVATAGAALPAAVAGSPPPLPAPRGEAPGPSPSPSEPSSTGPDGPGTETP